jgi:hypothetical protein
MLKHAGDPIIIAKPKWVQNWVSKWVENGGSYK